MQICARPHIRESDILIELHAEPRLVRRDDEAVLPLNRLFEDFAMESVPALDALEDEKVGAAGRELDVGGANHGPTIEMGRDLRVMGFRHARNLLRLQNPADA